MRTYSGITSGCTMKPLKITWKITVTAMAACAVAISPSTAEYMLKNKPDVNAITKRLRTNMM